MQPASSNTDLHSLRQQLAAITLTSAQDEQPVVSTFSDPPDQGKTITLAAFPDLLDRWCERYAKAIRQHSVISSASAPAIASTFPMILRLVSDQAAHLSANARYGQSPEALKGALDRLITPCLDTTHPFFLLNLSPKALVHDAIVNHRGGEVIYDLLDLFDASRQHLLGARPDAEARLQLLQKLATAMDKGDDLRNPFVMLSDHRRAQVFCGAAAIAFNPNLPLGHLQDYLIPYGALMKRLIHLSGHAADGAYVLPEHQARSMAPAAQQAIERFLQDIRDYPHYYTATSAGESSATLGTHFEAFFKTLEAHLSTLLSHPDLRGLSADTLYHALDPIRADIYDDLSEIKTERTSLIQGIASAPYLTQDDLHTVGEWLHTRFFDSNAEFARSGIVLSAIASQAFESVGSRQQTDAQCLQKALSNILSYCEQNKETIFANPIDGSLPSNIDQKLALLKQTASQFTSPSHVSGASYLPSLSASAKACTFIWAVEQASIPIVSNYDWSARITASNPLLRAYAERIHHTESSLQNPLTYVAYSERGRAALSPSPLQTESMRITTSVAPSSATVHPLTRCTLTPNGKEKFDARVARNAGKQRQGESPTEAELAELAAATGAKPGSLVAFPRRETTLTPPDSVKSV